MLETNTIEELIEQIGEDELIMSGYFSKKQTTRIIEKLNSVFKPRTFYGATAKAQDTGGYKWVTIYVNKSLTQTAREKIYYFKLGLEIGY